MPLSEKKKALIRQQALDACRKYFPDSIAYLDDYVSCDAYGKSPAYVHIVFYPDGRVFYDLCYRTPGKSNVYFISGIKSLNDYLEHLYLVPPEAEHKTCLGCGHDFEPDDTEDPSEYHTCPECGHSFKD